MKSEFKNLLRLGVIGLILVTSILNAVKAQEKKKEIVRIKVMCNDNGKLTTIDTSFSDNKMDITTIIESLNIPECASFGNMNIDSLVNDGILTTIVVDSMNDCKKMLSDEDDIIMLNDEVGSNGKKCKLIRIKLNGDMKCDSTFSFILNDEDSIMEDEMGKINIKNSDDKDKKESKVIKKKVIICKIIMKNTDNEDNKIIKKSVKNTSKNNLEVEKLGFYPNPSSGKFNLSFVLVNTGDVNIKILDATAREIYNEEIKDFSGNYSKEIDISDHKKGVYFIIINQGDKYTSKKIVLE